MRRVALGLGDQARVGTEREHALARQHTKTNLMVFLRPYIMYQQNGYQKLAEEKYEKMNKRRVEARLPNHLILPNDDKDKELPPFHVEDKVPPITPASGVGAASAPAAATSEAASAPAAASPAAPLTQP